MLPCLYSQATCLNSYHLHILLFEKLIEKANGVTSTAYTGNKIIWKTALCLYNLSPCLFSYYRLKIPNHHRIGMWAKDCSQDIMGIPHISCPVPKCLINSILECPAAMMDLCNLSTKEPHPEDIQ